MNSYIVLTDSESNAYSFRVLFPKDGYRPRRSKTETLKRTVSGKIDYQSGPVVVEWHYTLLVAETDPEGTDPDGGTYGTLSNLKTLFDRTDPNGTPTNLLTLKDHYENTHNVYMVGELSERPYSGQLSGTGAWFRVPIHLMETTAQ